MITFKRVCDFDDDVLNTTRINSFLLNSPVFKVDIDSCLGILVNINGEIHSKKSIPFTGTDQKYNEE